MHFVPANYTTNNNPLALFLNTWTMNYEVSNNISVTLENVNFSNITFENGTSYFMLLEGDNISLNNVSFVDIGTFDLLQENYWTERFR